MSGGHRDETLRIHLLRHAHAGDPLKWDGPDAARPLSAKGRRQAAALGALLVAADVRPEVIVSSPKVRARETADLVGAALGVTPVLDERLADDCDLQGLEDVVTDAGVREVMVVGHDPYLSELFGELLGAPGQAMPKGSIATFDVRRPLRRGGGGLRWFMPPAIVPPTGRD
jgi:phosphohistidine phosphatase SixA